MERYIFVFTASAWVIALGLFIAASFGEDVIFHALAFMMIGTVAALMQQTLEKMNARIKWLEDEVARREQV